MNSAMLMFDKKSSSATSSLLNSKADDDSCEEGISKKVEESENYVLEDLDNFFDSDKGNE